MTRPIFDRADLKNAAAICLVFSFSLFFQAPSQADTLVRKNGEEMKGLVVERHADRVILSTADGEVQVMLSEIKDIRYDSPEMNFMSIGQKYEAEEKYGEALAFYEKAVETNPEFEEAKQAAVGVRSRFWAASTEGPRGEMERQQALYDKWGSPDASTEAESSATGEAQVTALKESSGIVLEKKNDWTRIVSIESKKKASLAGLKKNDRLVSVDGNSQRYLGLETVRKSLLEPRMSNFVLEFERDLFIRKAEGSSLDLAAIGFKLKLEYEGLVVGSVKEDSLAEKAGLKEGDFLTRVNGIATRYMPYKRVVELIKKTEGAKIAFTVRRSTHMTRG
jgi:C-terminal processing protease CtpA/Prc